MVATHPSVIPPKSSVPSNGDNAQVGAFVLCNQSFYAAVQRGQLTLALHRRGQQYGVCHLAVPLETRTDRSRQMHD